MFEVGGPEKNEKADALAARMREVLADKEGVRPVAIAEIRVRDLSDADEEEDIRSAIATTCGYDPTLVKVGPVKSTGRWSGTAWVRCPLAAANKLVTARRLRVGWTNVRVKELEARPLQCFKCMAKGHVRAQCQGDVDRASLCYRCGSPGHIARECEAQVNCLVCRDLGRPAQHRAGSRACTAPRKKTKGGSSRTPAPGSAPAEGKTQGGTLAPSQQGREMISRTRLDSP